MCATALSCAGGEKIQGDGKKQVSDRQCQNTLREKVCGWEGMWKKMSERQGDGSLKSYGNH